MSIGSRPMTVDDYEDVAALWRASPGVGLSSSDDRAGVARFLAENPGLSLAACEGARLVGAVLCGHDGRRGFISHLAVATDARRRGVGSSLVAGCLDALAGAGIRKCHALVFTDNRDALAFWEREGWTRRTELIVMSALVRPRDIKATP